jgi:hypothetical protein
VEMWFIKMKKVDISCSPGTVLTNSYLVHRKSVCQN